MGVGVGVPAEFEQIFSGGTSDPYAIVQVSNEKRKTKVIKKDLNPEWAEKFELVVNDVHDSLKVRSILAHCLLRCCAGSRRATCFR